MKKFSLSTQIMLMILFVLMLSATLFSIIVIGRLNGVYEQQSYERLNSVIMLTKHKWDNDEEFDLKIEEIDIPLYFLKGDLIDGYERQDGLENCFSNKQDIDNFLRTISWHKDTNGHGEYENNTKSQIYYSYEISEKGNYIFVFTDEKYVSTLKNDISFQVIIIFFLVFSLSGIIILGWSKNITNRLYRIQTHVKNLAQNQFNDVYIDDGYDEISQLSVTVDTMRTQLQNTEKDKREMLQNLSHDFKTPISVIKSYAEALNDKVVSDEEVSKVICEQSILLQYKVNKLLQYNKLEYLNQDTEFLDVDIKSIIKNVIKNYKYQTDIKIELDLEEVFFKGYEENYYTVVENILDNAKRYAKSLIKIELKDNYLSIYNDGEHIDEKFVNGLFKAYEKGSKGEFGLGMSIVKKTLDFFEMELVVKNCEVGVIFIITKRKRQMIHTI